MDFETIFDIEFEVFFNNIVQTSNIRPKSKRWTDEEDNKLFSLYNEGLDIEKISKILGRTNASVCGRKNRLIVKKAHFFKPRYSKKWIDDDDELISLLNSGSKISEIAKKLNRSIGAVNTRINRLKSVGKLHD